MCDGMVDLAGLIHKNVRRRERLRQAAERRDALRLEAQRRKGERPPTRLDEETAVLGFGTGPGTKRSQRLLGSLRTKSTLPIVDLYRNENFELDSNQSSTSILEMMEQQRRLEQLERMGGGSDCDSEGGQLERKSTAVPYPNAKGLIDQAQEAHSIEMAMEQRAAVVQAEIHQRGQRDTQCYSDIMSE